MTRKRWESTTPLSHLRIIHSPPDDSPCGGLSQSGHLSRCFSAFCAGNRYRPPHNCPRHRFQGPRPATGSDPFRQLPQSHMARQIICNPLPDILCQLNTLPAEVGRHIVAAKQLRIADQHQKFQCSEFQRREAMLRHSRDHLSADGIHLLSPAKVKTPRFLNGHPPDYVKINLQFSQDKGILFPC